MNSVLRNHNPLPAGEGDESSMLAKLKTFSLVGIDALPVEVEVDVSPSGLPKQVLVGLPGGGGQGKHASRRAGDGQLGLPTPAEPHRDQPGPGRPAQGGRLVRSADRPGHAHRQRAGRFRAARRSTPSSASWPSTAARGRPRGALSMAMAAAEDKSLRGLIVPGRKRGRGGRRRRHRSHPRRQPRPGRRLSRRRDRDRADPLAAGRPVPRTGQLRRRFLRRPRPGDGQAGDHRRGRRRPQPADARPARLRQDDAGQADADDPARPHARANRSRPRGSTAPWGG